MYCNWSFFVILPQNFKKNLIMANESKKIKLPEKLKQVRESAGLPQRKIAAVLDIDTATYSKIENGKIMPSKEQIIMIAKTLNANESELLEMWMAARIVAIAESDIDIAPAAIKLVGETLKIDQQWTDYHYLPMLV